MDAFKDHDLILVELNGFGRLGDAHSPGKLIFRNEDAFAARKSIKMLIEKLHVQAERRLQIDLSLFGTWCRLGIDGLEIVVHSHIVSPDPFAFERLRDLDGCGGLAASGRPGQQNDGAGFHIGDDQIGSPVNFPHICRIGFLHKAFGIRDSFQVNLFQLIRHCKTPLFFPCRRIPCRYG